VKQAVTALDSHEPEERKKAVESLAQMSHPAARDALAGAVQHPTRDVRIDAGFRLAELTRYKDARAVRGLLDALQDKDARLCARAAHALGKIGDESAIPYLLDGIMREDGRTRREAASALSKMGAASVPGLLDALGHFDQRVRQVATWGLGEIKDAAAVPGLMVVLRDGDVTVQKEASEALFKIGLPAVVGLTEALTDGDWTVRVSAAKLLGEMGDSSAVPGLIGLLRDDYSDVRKTAADALGRLGDVEAVAALVEALYDPDSIDVCCAAADALASIGDGSAVPALTGILQRDTPQSRNVTNEKGIAAFGVGLNQFGSWNYQHLCGMVAVALETIGTPEALAAVEQWRREQGGQQA
jgi:HEAT repeat protein